jgi:large subunit ribosomal protein L24e
MTKCSFCGRDEKYFRGIHVIRNIGEVSFFCSSKCRKNSDKLKRDKRKLKWTEAFHESREKARAKEAQKVEVKEEQPAQKHKKKKLN